MIAASSGGLGDIVYAIPVMHRLGVRVCYVKESYYYPPYGNLYLAIKRLLESQSISCRPTDGSYPVMEFDPKITIDYNLDLARTQPRRGFNPIIISYLNQFNLSHTNWNQPFLKIPAIGKTHDYNLIHRTSRWRKGSHVNWKQLIRRIDNPHFIGFIDEYESFCKEVEVTIPYIKCADIYEMAKHIKEAKALFCNQSVALTLAQGMGTLYYLERNPGKTNCLFKTKNERIL